MTQVDIGLILVPIIASITAVAVAIVNRYKPRQQDPEQNKTIIDLQLKIARMDERQNLFNKVIENKLIEAFHSPHTPRLDSLLAKIKPNTITKAELIESKGLIEKEIQREIDNGRNESPRMSQALQLLLYIEFRILEKSWKLTQR